MVKIIGFLVSIMLVEFAYAEDVILWNKSDTGIDETKIGAIRVVKGSPRVIYAGGERGIYKSTDSGTIWQRVFMLNGERKGINFIADDPQDSNRIFACTGDGLYMSIDAGKSWDRSFRGKEELQGEISCIAVDRSDSSSIYIGTKRGLFSSKDAGIRWRPQGSFTNKEIISVAISKNGIYVCAIDGVYFDKKGSDLWERIYVKQPTGQEAYGNYNNGDMDDNGDVDEENMVAESNHMSVFGDIVYLATNDGMFIHNKSEDKRWQVLNSEGLLNKKIRFVLPTDIGVFVATESGVFYYKEEDKRWSSISSGMSTLDINMIDFAPKERLLYAATDNGVYRLELDNAGTEEIYNKKYTLQRILADEPSISDIQKEAIRYAEVSDKKIEWMRNAAKNKAWLPEVTAGLDGDVSKTIDMDRGGTNDEDFYIVGPKDKGWGWDVGASWDLGELIWNDAQTSIDVRSRLMVQLRNDILDEVTKLYFERRRLQYEIYSQLPKNEEKMLQSQLRLEELTANIDAITGGYLSNNIER